MITLPRYYGMPLALLRHTTVFALAAGAVWIQSIVLGNAIEQTLGSWILVAAGVGVLSAILARRVVGVVFVAAGYVVGLIAVLVGQTGAATAMGANSALYLEVVEVAMLAYLLTAIALMRLRGSPQA